MSREGEVFWLEQTITDVPATDEWLAPAEQEILRAFRVPKRASDWRLGRWTAKRLLAQTHCVPAHYASLATIQIIPADSGAPQAFVSGARSWWNLSISHSNGRALCAVAPGKILIGCDVERIETRSECFITDYFTSGEQRAITSAAPLDRALFSNLIWSAKESALKALKEGLRLDTRQVAVTHVGSRSRFPAWAPLTVRINQCALLQGWWQSDENFVRTIVANPGCSTHLTPRLSVSVMSVFDASALAHATAD